MHVRFAACTLLALMLLLITPAPFEAATSFPDMDGRWFRYREAVEYLQEKGIVGGYEDGTFKPTQTINRAELLKLIFAGKSKVTPSQRRCFSDVNPDAWYAPYVCTAKQRGIVSGYPDGTFRGEETVNFAEAVKMVLHAYGHQVTEGEGKQWYKPYTEAIAAEDILPQHSYLPWQPLTRERAADLLWRVLKHDQERFIPRLSAGCGRAKPVAPTSVTVRGQERSFLITVPASYVPHDPMPLVVAFHGRTNSNEQVRKYMGLDRELGKSIIAYPAALKTTNGSFSWANPGDKAQEIRDIAFFDAIVEKLAEDYCIDMDRIVVVGHSLGAWMANTVACVRGDVVRASATVGGDSVITTCNGPAAAMIMHNPKDNLAPFSGAQRVLALRLETNVCGESKPSEPGPSNLQCKGYSGCTGKNDIWWCPHTVDTEYDGTYYPHVWPKDAAKELAGFLRQLYSDDDAIRR
jgi:polyhydroxybutyrate depolymerase